MFIDQAWAHCLHLFCDCLGSNVAKACVLAAGLGERRCWKVLPEKVGGGGEREGDIGNGPETPKLTPQI